MKHKQRLMRSRTFLPGSFYLPRPHFNFVLCVDEVNKLTDICEIVILTIDLTWPNEYHKSLPIRLFVQKPDQANNKENNKEVQITGHMSGESTGDRGKGSIMWAAFPCHDAIINSLAPGRS